MSWIQQARAWVNIWARIRRLEKQQVTTDEKIQQVETDLTGIKNDFGGVIVPGIASLNATIAGLKTQLAGVDLSPAASAALDAVVAEADALKASADNVAAGFGVAPVVPATPAS